MTVGLQFNRNELKTRIEVKSGSYQTMKNKSWLLYWAQLFKALLA